MGNLHYPEGVSTTPDRFPETLDALLDAPGGRLFYRPPATRNPEAEFERVAQLYPELRVEMEADGTISMSPGSTESGEWETEVLRQLANWNNATRLGHVFSPSAVFRLPSGAKRQADAAWISREAYRQFSKTEKQGFRGFLVPAFVIEVLSPTDRLVDTQAKCREWTAAGVLEAWLIHPYGRLSWRYVPGEGIGPDEASALSSPLLPGFTLQLEPVWEMAQL
jgi:Uma2 family endonuclease